MGTNAENRIDVIGKMQLFRTRPAAFMVRWRALQHELACKASRLDLLTEISEIVAAPRRAQNKSNDVTAHFQKSLLSNSMVS